MNISEFLIDYLSKEQIKDFLRAYDLKISGNKDEIIERLISYNEFDVEEIPVFLYKEELQEICDILELPRSGNKDELWGRIIDEVGSLEFSKTEEETRRAVVHVKEVEEVEESIQIGIKEIKAPERVLSKSNNFQVDLIISNEGKSEEVVQIWRYAVWPEGGRGMEPKFRLEPGKETIEEIFLPTPKTDGTYKIVIKLLDDSETLIKDQKIPLDIDVKTSGSDKVIKWIKTVGKSILTVRKFV